jgi:hypothetical protein
MKRIRRRSSFSARVCERLGANLLTAALALCPGISFVSTAWGCATLVSFWDVHPWRVIAAVRCQPNSQQTSQFSTNFTHMLKRLRRDCGASLTWMRLFALKGTCGTAAEHTPLSFNHLGRVQKWKRNRGTYGSNAQGYFLSNIYTHDMLKAEIILVSILINSLDASTKF